MGRVSEESDSLLVAPIAADLRRVLADGTTLTALRGLELPAIDGVLEAHGLNRQSLPELITAAIGRMDDQVYRGAAEDLFPFPYREVGWPKLSARGREAAEHLGIGYEGLRKASEGRPSHLEKVLLQLAEKLVTTFQEVGSAASRTEAVGSKALTPAGEADAPDRIASPIGRRKARLLACASLAFLIMVALSAWVVAPELGKKPDGSTQGSGYLPAGCHIRVGQLDKQVASEPDAKSSTSRLVDRYRTAASGETIGCPSSPAHRWQSIVVQELARNGHSSGALLVSANGVDLYLNNAAWGSYHQLGGKTGDSAQTTAGLPIRMVPYEDGHVEIELSAGVVLVAEALDAPYYWIPAVFVSWWRDHQAQVGLPTGNPLPTFRQDFQRGVVSVNPPDLAIPVFTVVTTPQEELPSLATIRGHILRQPDATTWFVTPEGKRQWIPDGETWSCLGGDAARVSRDLPGYAIATLPFAGQAVCPS